MTEMSTRAALNEAYGRFQSERARLIKADGDVVAAQLNTAAAEFFEDLTRQARDAANHFEGRPRHTPTLRISLTAAKPPRASESS
jgi:hypothetical protein